MKHAKLRSELNICALSLPHLPPCPKDISNTYCLLLPSMTCTVPLNPEHAGNGKPQLILNANVPGTHTSLRRCHCLLLASNLKQEATQTNQRKFSLKAKWGKLGSVFLNVKKNDRPQSTHTQEQRELAGHSCKMCWPLSSAGALSRGCKKMTTMRRAWHW